MNNKQPDYSKPFPSNPLLFLWLYARKNFLILISIILCSYITVGLSKYTGYLFSRFVDLFKPDTVFSDIQASIYKNLGFIILYMIIIYVFQAIYRFMLNIILQPRIYRQITSDTFKYINQHSVNFFNNNMAGALANKTSELYYSVNAYSSLLYFGQSVFNVIATIVAVGLINFLYASIFVLGTIISIVILWPITKKTLKYRKIMTDNRNQVSGKMIDTLQNNIFVRIFNAFKYEKRQSQKIFNQENTITQRSVIIESFESEGEQLYFEIFTLLFLFYGLYMWHNQTISGGDFVFIFIMIQNFAQNISFLIHRSIIYSGMLAELRTNLLPFSVPHEITDLPDAKDLVVKRGQIDLKNVCFAYPNRHPIFKNFNLTIPAGQKVGIVGMSGGGKSTLISLLQRFYTIQQGSINIDGQDITKVTQESLHRNIGYVPQVTELLERSVAANIAYSNPKVSTQQVINAARQAYADDFIQQLPFGYKTIMNGQHKLSGGQMQRLSIARTILKNAPILILDEATSSLDSESEFYIQKAIENMLQNKTVIAVAHRLSTLKNMDRIIVLEKGKIVEDGAPQALLRQKGKFYQYHQLQKLKEQNHD